MAKTDKADNKEQKIEKAATRATTYLSKAHYLTYIPRQFPRPRAASSARTARSYSDSTSHCLLAIAVFLGYNYRPWIIALYSPI